MESIRACPRALEINARCYGMAINNTAGGDRQSNGAPFAARNAPSGRAFERQAQIGRRLKARVRRLRQALAHDRLYRRRRIEWLRILVNDGADDRGRRTSSEGASSSEHFVQHGPKGENIGARIGRLALGLLRRHIRRRAHDGARLVMTSMASVSSPAELSSSCFANPKSSSLTTPLVLVRMFAGFRSR